MDGFLGEIRMFAFPFAPRGWLTCSGQLLAINQNTALFALLGTSYGGNGTTNFQLPDLRGRVINGMGQGPNLSNYTIGQQGGVENVTLTTANLPAHSHSLLAQASGDANFGSPNGNYPGIARSRLDASSVPLTRYTAPAPGITQALQPGSISQTGGGQAHPNLQPYLAQNYCICIQGYFPSRQ